MTIGMGLLLLVLIVAAAALIVTRVRPRRPASPPPTLPDPAHAALCSLQAAQADPDWVQQFVAEPLGTQGDPSESSETERS